MSIDYSTLGVLWADLMDALSGRPSLIEDPPVLSSDWPDKAPGWVVPSTSGADFVLTIEAPSGSVDLTCPLPALTEVGWRNVIADPLWRRCLMNSWGAAPNPGFGAFGRVIDARVAINSYLWSTVGTHGYASAQGPLSPSNATPWLPMFNFLTYWSILDPTPTWPDTPYLTEATGQANLIFDLAAQVVLYCEVTPYGTFMPYSDANPLSPADQTPLVTALEFPGGLDVSVAGPDINALNNLADAFVAGGGPDGTVQTHRGKPLFSVSSSSMVLPKATGTSDNMAHRVAAAVRNVFAGGFSLRTQRPNATVAVNRGIIVRRR